MPDSTASVARWTSTGLASKLNLWRETASVSTSSSNTIAAPPIASSGIVCSKSLVIACWLRPNAELAKACGSTSTKVHFVPGSRLAI